MRVPVCANMYVYLNLTLKSDHLSLGLCCLGKILQQPGCSWFDSRVDRCSPVIILENVSSCLSHFSLCEFTSGSVSMLKELRTFKGCMKLSMDLMI